MKIIPISAGTLKLDGGAMHGVVPKSIWQKLNPADANNLCTWQMRCMLIENGKQLTLVDTGMGAKQSEKWQSYYEPNFEQNLEKSIVEAGYHPTEITNVILSHLHFDHAGGAVKKQGELLIPTFENATYWVSQNQWNTAMQPNDREKATFLHENLMPLEQSGQLKFVGQKSVEELKNIEFIEVFGHTEGMLMPLVSSPNGKVLFAADTIPSHHHVHLPYVMAYDINPIKTIEEKKNLYTRAIAEDWIIFYDHDPHVAFGKIVLTEKGYRNINVD